MSRIEIKTETPVQAARPYQGWWLVEVVRQIVDQADPEALRELHNNRRLFRLRDSGPLLLAELVSQLCASSWARQFAGGTTDLLDRAYDLTIDKFSHLPGAIPAGATLRTQGPDCRGYFRIFLELWNRQAAPGPLDFRAEAAAAQLLQQRVVRSFRLSCLEARRLLNPARNRYAWETPGGVIYLWLPAALPGSCRRRWLAENIGPCPAASPAEQRRVQAIIDARLGFRSQLSLEGQVGGGPAAPERDWEGLLEEEVSSRGLAEVVAAEKAAQLQQQRPAIRGLGCAVLKQLVRRILEDVTCDRYDERSVARAFGISPPTLSRFAGHRWRRDGRDRPPDLWSNVAQTLAGHSVFVSLAQEVGVWPQVQGVAARAAVYTRSENAHA